MKAGRLDIIVHSIIAGFFLSHAMREDVEMHLILNGPPDPPKHIHMYYDPNMPISKKDIGNLLRATLWKYKPGRKVLAFPGVEIEKRSFESVVEEHAGYELYLLDEKGIDVGEVEFGEHVVFVLGDHEGLPRKTKKFVKQRAKATISIGPYPYFTSQCISFMNIWLDRVHKNV